MSTSHPRYMVVQLGRIGDLILHTPIFRALKTHQPDCEIHLLASRHNCDFAFQHPLIDRVFVHTKKLYNTFRLIVHLRSFTYSAWIDPKYHHSSESQFFARLGRAPIKIGYNRKQRGAFTHPVIVTAEHETEHLAAHCLRTLHYLHIDNNDLRPILFVNDRSAAQFNHFLRAAHIESYYCVNISSNAPDRGWPRDRWVEFLNAVHNPRFPFVLLSSLKHRDYARQIASIVPDTHFYPTQSIVDVFSVVNRAALVITPDTSIVHIASAFDKPLFALYVNLREFYSKFYPLSSHFRAVMHPKPGSLVADISVDFALEQFNSLLDEL